MPAGRPPKPTEVKRLLGNPGKRTLPEPSVTIAPAVRTPAAPATLREAGRQKWRELWRVARKWLSPDTDAGIVERYCSAWDEAYFLIEQITDEDGNIDPDKYFKMSPTSGHVVHPAVRELRKIQTLMTKYESLLGLTPSDRARLGLAEIEAASKLDAFLGKRR